jgi:nucleoside-diphosphate-sugar epimerase
MSHYLVTGGAGFIGSHITQALVGRGDRVRVLDDLSSGRRENLAGLEGVELQVGDIRDPKTCAAAVAGVDGVFHEAAQVSVPSSVEDPEFSYAVNVTGTLGVLEAARAAGVQRVVFAASSAAYGDGEALPKVEEMPVAPCSPYASGKIAGEHLMRTWARCFGMHTVSLRYFNVFGPRQADDSPYSGVIAKFARILLEGRLPTIFGDGGQTRDFIYVEDVAAANLAAMDADLEESGTVINIGGGDQVSLNDLYATLAEAAGVTGAPEYGPERAGDVRHSVADVERAARLLGFEARVPWREGLAHTLAWYREQLNSPPE